MTNLNESAVRFAILTNRGNLTAAAESFEVSSRELREFIRIRPALASFVADLREQMVDEAEARLRDALSDKKSWAVTFILKTMGKNRGYGKHPAPPSEPQPETEAQPDLTKLNEKELKRYVQLRDIACDYSDDPEFVENLDFMREEVGPALVMCGGNMATAAQELGVTRAELTEYLDRRPELKAGVEEAHEELVDAAELVLREAIDEKMPWAIRFVLKTLGRSRGFTENPRDEVKPQPTSTTNFDLDRLSSAQRAEFENLTLMMRQRAKEGNVEPAVEETMRMISYKI